MLQKILSQYAISEPAEVLAFGTGLINGTWKITDRSGEFILQKINQEVFKAPRKIEKNIAAIAAYLSATQPSYLFPSPFKTVAGEEMVFIEEQGYFRLFPFVGGSSTIDVVNNPDHAREAARQFGRFTRLLSRFPVYTLEYTIPDFHNLSLRYDQFETALLNGNPDRMEESSPEITFLRQHSFIADRYKELCTNPAFKKRVTHHDTKISNVLFDQAGKGMCVIDLDTIMPGYFISDFGDMMRTYLSPVSEEETDLGKIQVRKDYFAATLEGYLSEMINELNDAEISHMVYSGMFMIYMQAMRFLTDYLNNDRYYGARYEKHNLLRARNQIVLLQQLMEHQYALEQTVTQCVTTMRSTVK